MLVIGLLLVLIADALMLLAADRVTDGDLSIDSFWSALGVALVASAVSVVLDVDLRHERRRRLHPARDPADRASARASGSRPTRRAIVYLEIDGLALPVLQRAMRDGNAPNMARWLVEGGYTLTEWETDLSSQTGASQAGILLGSNDDIPAFRWVEKETATTMTCSAPPDCAEIERRHAGHGLLRDGGASRGNLLSGEADHVILTVSRMEAEKKANPGYRAFLANGFNVTRVLVLLFWEVDARALRLEPRQAPRRAAARAPRRHLPADARGALRVRPRPDRLRRPPGHDEGPARDLRDVLELRRGRAPLGPRARRHARGAAQARPAVRPDRARPASTPRGRTRSSSSPTTARRRARRSSSATATGSTSSSSARSRAASVERRRGRRRAELDGRPRVQRGDRQGAGQEAQEERRLRQGRRRDGLGQPRARLPDGRAPPPDARGDERAPSRPDPGAPQPPARRLAARPLVRARPRRARRRRRALSRRRQGRGRGPARATSRRTRRSTCSARTGSPTSPTS